VLEQETDTIVRAIVERIAPTARGTIAIKDILAADIPYALKTFFRTDVEMALLNEQQQYRKTSRFNLDHPEVRNLQQQINSILVLNYIIPASEFLHRLDDTVHMTVNYLIRPQWTMGNVLFEKEQTVPVHTLIRMMQYFGPYEYLKDITGQYLQGKQIESISKDSLKTLLWKIDGEYIRRKSGDEIAKVMQPMYDFFDYPAKSGKSALLTKALVKYFEDKGLTMVLPRLEGEIAQGKTELTQAELGSVLEDVRRTLGTFQVEHVESDQHDLIEIRKDTKSQSGTSTEPHTFNFESLIGESDKRRFIKKIFNHDENQYTTALQPFNQMTSWKQVSKYIDELFITHDIDPYSSEAKKFIDVMFKCYHSKL